jgi:hypothetical protein
MPKYEESNVSTFEIGQMVRIVTPGESADGFVRPVKRQVTSTRYVVEAHAGLDWEYRETELEPA